MILFSYFFLNCRGQWGFDNPATDSRADLGERTHVIDIEGVECRANPPAQLCGVEEIAERSSRRRETVGYPDAGRRELAQHFAERGVLAADRFEVGHAQFAEWNDVRAAWHALSRSLV